VEALTALVSAVSRIFYGWRPLPDLQFSDAETARLLAGLLAAVALTAVLLGLLLTRHRRAGIALPALLGWVGPSRVALLRHGALACAIAGLPFFILAVADPRTTFKRQETSYPGRRITLMIDASSSMLSSFPSSRLAKGAPSDAAFFTSVGAARYFVELRMRGKYRDLMSLVEFGDDAYVITPFTSDHENILLSISLIGDWSEFMAFPDQGTVIARAIDQGVGLFDAFDFLDASGNLMVIFTDGVDAEILQDGRSAFDVLRDAERAKIPVYFIRTIRASPIARGRRPWREREDASTPRRTRARSFVRCRRSTRPRPGRFRSASTAHGNLRLRSSLSSPPASGRSPSACV
jgi:hypothetical protein